MIVKLWPTCDGLARILAIDPQFTMRTASHTIPIIGVQLTARGKLRPTPCRVDLCALRRAREIGERGVDELHFAPIGSRIAACVQNRDVADRSPALNGLA